MFATIRRGVILALAGISLAAAPAAFAQKANAPATTPAAKTAPAAPTTAAPAAAAKTTKTPSVCKGLDQAACGKLAECIWRAESVRKNGSKVKAHCRKKPDIAKAQAAKEAKKAAAAAAKPAEAAKAPATTAPAKKN